MTITNQREWNDQARSIRYRYIDGYLSGTRHIAGKDGKPLCMAHIESPDTAIAGGTWENVTGEATCSVCKKRSRSW